jgi:hypothetical protein
MHPTKIDDVRRRCHTVDEAMEGACWEPLM